MAWASIDGVDEHRGGSLSGHFALEVKWGVMRPITRGLRTRTGSGAPAEIYAAAQMNNVGRK